MMCTERTSISWAFTPSDQSLRCLHEEALCPKILITHKAKTLIRLDSDQTKWMPRLIWLHWEHRWLCWFCHASDHIRIHNGCSVQIEILSWRKLFGITRLDELCRTVTPSDMSTQVFSQKWCFMDFIYVQTLASQSEMKSIPRACKWFAWINNVQPKNRIPYLF